MDKVDKAIEKLRDELNISLASTDSYSDGRTLKISQELDELINKHVKYRYKQYI